MCARDAGGKVLPMTDAPHRAPAETGSRVRRRPMNLQVPGGAPRPVLRPASTT